MPPYAVRIRTATGWQDIAMTGPPGPPGGIWSFTLMDWNDNNPESPGQAAVNLTQLGYGEPMDAFALNAVDANGNDWSIMRDALDNSNGYVYFRSKADPKKWICHDCSSAWIYSQSYGWRFDDCPYLGAGPNGAPTPGACDVLLFLMGGEGPVGPIGPPGGYQMYAYGTGSGNITGTSTTLIPLTLPAAQITKSDGTNPDFILNPNKTVKIVKAGYYLVTAEVGANQSSSVTQNFNSFLYLTGTDTTGTDPYSWQQIDEQHAVMTNVSGYGAITTHAIGRYFNAGDNVAVLASYGNTGIWTNVLTFSISRIGSGAKGADGLVTIYEQPNAPTNPVVGSVWVDTDDSVPAGTVVPRRTGFSWAIKGTIIAETQPSYFVPIATGQISQLLGVRAKIASGTSVVCQLQQNGTNIGTAVTVTPTKATTLFTPIALVDGDEIALVTSSPTGNPTNLSITAIMEHRA